jgi:hypothetical protein
VAPGYSAAILKPMSLSVIRDRLHDGTISNITEMYLALNLMLTNASLFNPVGSEVYKITQLMLDVVKRECEPLLAVEMLQSLQ